MEINWNEWIRKMDTNAKEAGLREYINKMHQTLSAVGVSSRAAELERFFNIALNNNNQETASLFAQRYQEMIQGLTQKALNNYSPGENKIKVSRPNYKDSYNKKTISLQRLSKVINEINSYFDQMAPRRQQDVKVYDALLAKKRNAMKVLSSIYETYLSPDYLGGDIKYLTSEMAGGEKELSTMMRAVNHLLAIHKMFKQETMPMSQKDIGDALEFALGSFSEGIKVTADTKIDELVNELIKEKVVTGGEYTYGDKIIDTTVNIEEALKRGVVKKGEDGYYSIDSDQGYFQDIDIDEGGAIRIEQKRQGKMDIHFTMPSGSLQGETFRISAKNWSTLSGHDLGGTSIARAIARSTSEDMLQKYSFGLQDKEVAKDLLHEFAKLCIAVDVVMGYSQVNAYADTLVIYDRSANYIYVRSIGDLLLSLGNEASALAFQGYDDGSIEATARDLRAKVYQLEQADPEDTESTEMYYGLIHQILNQLIVTVTVRAEQLRQMS